MMLVTNSQYMHCLLDNNANFMLIYSLKYVSIQSMDHM